MRSTSDSEAGPEAGPLIRARRLCLEFQTSFHRAQTLREAFVRTLSRPFSGANAPAPDRLHIARSLNFKFTGGDRVGLLGVNGAGKTSLCRCLAGYFKPTSGKLVVRGRVRAMFDTGLGIQPELTGRENADLLAHFLFPDERDLRGLVDEALDFSGLGRFVDAPFRTYSNGMQARLCLSLASARPTDVLILDEVFDGADEFFREKISARIVKTIEASGIVIFVSHSAEQIQRVCNRVLVLHEGRIRFDGAVEDGIRAYRELSAGR